MHMDRRPRHPVLQPLPRRGAGVAEVPAGRATIIIITIILGIINVYQ